MDDWDNMKQGVEDCSRWVSMELDNEMHKRRHRIINSLAYFDDAKGLLENELANLPEDDWRDDR